MLWSKVTYNKQTVLSAWKTLGNSLLGNNKAGVPAQLWSWRWEELEEKEERKRWRQSGGESQHLCCQMVWQQEPSHLCNPLLDLNLCRRFNAGTKLPELTLKLRGLTLLVPTTTTWEVWIYWTHLQQNRGPRSNHVAGTCTSSGTPSCFRKMARKEAMNRRQFQAQLASSLILVNTALQTPKRGRPSSGKGSPATVTSGSPLTPQKRASKRNAHLPLDVRKDLDHISQWRQWEEAADTALKDTLTCSAASVMFALVLQKTRTVFGTFTMNKSQPWKEKKGLKKSLEKAV